MSTAPANAGNTFVDLNAMEKEIHRLLDTCETQKGIIDEQLPTITQAIEGELNEDGTVKDGRIGIVRSLFEMREDLTEHKTIIEDFRKELRALDEKTDRSRKIWAAAEDMGDVHGFRSTTYRALADVYRVSHEAFSKHNYTQKVEGYTRAADQSSTTDTLGGIMVPTTTWDDVAWIMSEQSFLRAFANKIDLPSDDIKVPYLPAIPTMYVQGSQGSEPTHGSLIFDDTQIMSTKTYLGLNVIPNQFVQDAIRIWSIFWARVFTSAMALKENKGMFSEKPTDSNGAFSGIIQEVEAGAAPYQHVHTLASSHFSTITYDDLVAIQLLPNENSCDGNRWFVNRAVAPYIFRMKTTDGLPLIGPIMQGGPTATPKPMSSGARSTQLLMDPFHTTAALPSTNAASKSFLVYGNPAFTFWGERAPMAIEFSKEAAYSTYCTVMRVAERIAQKTIAIDAWAIAKTSA